MLASHCVLRFSIQIIHEQIVKITLKIKRNAWIVYYLKFDLKRIIISLIDAEIYEALEIIE